MGRIKGKPGPKPRRGNDSSLFCRVCGAETAVLYDGLCTNCYLEAKRNKKDCIHPQEAIERIPGVTDTGTRYVRLRCDKCGKTFGTVGRVGTGRRADPDFDQEEIDRVQGTKPYPGEENDFYRQPNRRR